MNIESRQPKERLPEIFTQLNRINRCSIEIKADMMELCNYLFVLEDMTGNCPQLFSRSIENICRQATQIYSMSAGYEDYYEGYLQENGNGLREDIT